MSKGCWAVWGIEDMWWRWEMWGGESYGFLVSIIWCVPWAPHWIFFILFHNLCIINLLVSSYRLLINFTGMWNLVTRYVSFSYCEPHCVSPFSIDIDNTWQLLSERPRPVFLTAVLVDYNFPRFPHFFFLFCTAYFILGDDVPLVYSIDLLPALLLPSCLTSPCINMLFSIRIFSHRMSSQGSIRIVLFYFIVWYHLTYELCTNLNE